ncbi:hypothetical protein GCM10009749_15110 [Agromyces neolithicus]|uniref:ABC transporter domain-containing protein n=1 Tax=Agromyces neolithicus TaxID=269420 RepID=A0ABN2M3L5_9MICO
MRRTWAKTRAKELLDRVGLADFAGHYPAGLSGGQQQRVAIARALAMDPKLMLFDEPTSALDPDLVGDVLDVMRQLANDGTTIIVVTHEIGFARGVADQEVFLDGGVIVEAGRPEDVIDQPSRKGFQRRAGFSVSQIGGQVPRSTRVQASDHANIWLANTSSAKRCPIR